MKSWCCASPAFALCLSLGTVGCGTKDNPMQMDNPDLTTAPGNPDLSMPVLPPDLSGVLPTPLNMNGVWASRVVNAQVFKSNLIGMQTVFLTTLARVQITQADGGTTTTGMSSVCSVNLTAFKGNQTTYPDKAIKAIPDETSTATLSAARVGATYKPAERVQIIGWHPQGDPKTEMLPTMPKDGRVFDADMDGHPGVTLHVKGPLVEGDVYIVNRSVIDFNATVVSNDRVTGSSHTEQEQVVLDATNALLKGEVLTTPDLDPTKSTFDMARLTAGKDTCAAIVAGAGTLFK